MFSPIQNVHKHVWSMPNGLGQDQIPRTFWHGPNGCYSKGVFIALTSTKRRPEVKGENKGPLLTFNSNHAFVLVLRILLDIDI